MTKGLRAPKGSKFGGKARSWRKRKTDAAKDQPVANPTNSMPCRLCGHPVDRKRMHFHMVRFHGAAFRPNG